MVEQFGIKYYWEVDGYKLCNKHLANWYERDRNCWATFVAQQFSSIEHNLSDRVLDIDRNYNLEYLQKLRHAHNNLHLLFSGGSDSITVFEQAVANNIVFDEVISLIIENIDLPCNQEIKYNAIPYINKYKKHYNKFTIENTSFDILSDYYSNPYQFFTMASATSQPMNIGRPFVSIERRNHVPGTCYIKCTDKPTLVHYKNSWYATFHDGSWGGCNSIPNLVYFWLEGDNIKSYIKDARIYRDNIKKEHIIGQSLRFFKADALDTLNTTIRTNPQHLDRHFKKTDGKTIDQKDAARFTDALYCGRYDLLTNYFTCLNEFYKVFPETKHNGFAEYNKAGKFAWFINIDTLELYTQNELIPNGFKV